MNKFIFLYQKARRCKYYTLNIMYIQETNKIHKYNTLYSAS